MRAVTAYFVGAGTIVAAIAIGLGGGLVAGNIMNPTSPKQGPDLGRWERSGQPAMAAAMQPSERVPYVAGTQAMVAALGAPAPAETDNVAAQTAAAPAPQPTAAAEEKPAATKSADARPSAAAKLAQPQGVAGSATAPENAYAKASDADVKRAAAEQRRAERHRRWAERRRQEMREPREARDRTDWNDVARNVREDSEQREWTPAPRPGFPQIRLFGSDDD
ncbi:hypothetical protein [Bradyrhizobium sp.]|uniref:hypothetical protein n=1 Tax=Bradyrhizobium sp. TaxID=376 RepID=UPI00238B4742|nr:hypothetical protein [Bradyrhizobium sp.]MDE2377762.1 hypothetical protein [Bradyrhizobium sp.]